MKRDAKLKIGMGLGAAALLGIGVAVATSDDAEAAALPQCPPGSRWDPTRQACVPILGPVPAPGPMPGPTPSKPPRPPVPVPGPPRPPAPGPAPKPAPKPPKPTPQPKPAPHDAKPKPSANALGREAQNAALVVVKMPATFPPRGLKYAPKGAPGSKERRDGLVNWLTDVAFYSTYPKSPTKLTSSKKDAAYRQAWVRLRKYVERGLALKPKLGPNPVLPDALANLEPGRGNWERWALAIAFRGPMMFRSANILRTAFKKGWFWVFKDDAGKAWAKKWKGRKVAGRIVDLDGLLGEAGIWMASRPYAEAKKQLESWPNTLTKAFTATNGTFTRSKL